MNTFSWYKTKPGTSLMKSYTPSVSFETKNMTEFENTSTQRMCQRTLFLTDLGNQTDSAPPLLLSNCRYSLQPLFPGSSTACPRPLVLWQMGARKPPGNAGGPSSALTSTAQCGADPRCGRHRWGRAGNGFRQSLNCVGVSVSMQH